MGDFDFRHGVAVAARVLTSDAKLVALLHDTVEDGVLTGTELSEVVQGDVLIAVVILTRSPRDQSYADYITRIAEAPGCAGALARTVKRADLAENLGRIDAEHESLRERWEAALAHLSSIEEET
jgi:GTP diphosphokinase / guanosine-3',5'-bis(diphosphate) 3'-diphosphatase